MSKIMMVSDAASVTYKDGVPRADTLSFRDTAAWVSGGLAGLWRADQLTFPAGGTPAARWAGLLGTGRTLDQPAGQTGALTLQTGSGYFSDHKTALATGVAGDLFYWGLSEAIIPATGPFEVWLAVHPTTSTFHLLGQSDSTKLSASIVSGQIRLNFANSGSGTYSVTANKASGNFSGNDVLIHLRRDAANYGRIRYKMTGLPWVEAVSAYPITSAAAGGGTALALPADLRLGSYRAQSGYSPAGRWQQIVLGVGDISAAARSEVDEYLSYYCGVAATS